MLQSEAELTAVLHGTPLQGREVVRMEPPGPGYEAVLAVDVEGLDLFQVWQVLRERVGQTGRWPVLYMAAHSWGGHPFRILMEQEALQLYFRGSYSDEHDRGDRASDAPADLIAHARDWDIDGQLRLLAQRQDEYMADFVSDLPGDVSRACEETEDRFGMAPDVGNVAAFIAQHGFQSEVQIERWFLDWELAHCPEPLALPEWGLSHLSWYEPGAENVALLLMPSQLGEDSLAYVHWFDAESHSSAFMIAMLRAWREKYGAELVAHYGTMLQFVVARPPTTIDDAFELACQQDQIASCTIGRPGVALRDHARALLQTDRWFLHARP